MPGMGMPAGAWYHAATGYLGMWMAMMVPMMLPSLVPALLRYRRSLRAEGGILRQGLTLLAGVGYFGVWAALGLAVCAAGVGLMAAEARWTAAVRWVPVASGLVLFVAGAVQLTAWKARQLAYCREDGSCCSSPSPTGLGAVRHGVRLGLQCSRCCGSLMLALLAAGMMNLAAMAAVTVAITAERLAPEPTTIARVSGVLILVAGVIMTARG